MRVMALIEKFLNVFHAVAVDRLQFLAWEAHSNNIVGYVGKVKVITIPRKSFFISTHKGL